MTRKHLYAVGFMWCLVVGSFLTASNTYIWWEWQDSPLIRAFVPLRIWQSAHMVLWGVLLPVASTFGLVRALRAVHHAERSASLLLVGAAYMATGTAALFLMGLFTPESVGWVPPWTANWLLEIVFVVSLLAVLTICSLALWPVLRHRRRTRSAQQ